jgi:hypothetical protein
MNEERDKERFITRLCKNERVWLFIYPNSFNEFFVNNIFGYF